jgi:flagellar biosynthesis protein FlhG
MHDQANHLRRLARRCASEEISRAAERPRLIVLTAGKGGVGTTTVAVNLAVAMASRRLRTVLVDADPCGGDAAVLCGLEQRYTLAEMLASRRTVREVLQSGPGAIQVVSGGWGLENLPDGPAVAGRRLFRELESLGRFADLLLLDGGKGPNPVLRQLWQAADLRLVLATPETSSILNSYALIKLLAEDSPAVPVHLLVNLAPTMDVAEEVGRRLAEACRRLLGLQLTSAGYLPADPHVAGAAAVGQPFAIAAPRCGAARHLGRLADALAALLAGREGDRACLPTRSAHPPGKPAAPVADAKTPEIAKSQKSGRND